MEEHYGSRRFVYNYFLEERDKYCMTHGDTEGSSLNYLDTQNMITELKKTHSWLY
ncbi:helix-turn-helix domain-containing protein [Thermoplasma acidophilum]|uniref:helix-turn-helix domain-containing protein n=1 Tax=Thermoplasma acidophilum TaxID=2303 RepID=UPI0012EADC30